MHSGKKLTLALPYGGKNLTIHDHLVTIPALDGYQHWTNERNWFNNITLYTIVHTDI